MKNVEDVNKYVTAIESEQSAVVESEKPTDLEKACETAVLNLRRLKGIDLQEYRKRTEYDALELFAAPIDRYEKMGLMAVQNNRIHLTRPGLPIADSILCDFATV